MKMRFHWGIAAALLLILSACGDNRTGDQATAPTTIAPVPTIAEATATPATMTETGGVTTTMADTTTGGVDNTGALTDTTVMTDAAGSGVGGATGVTGTTGMTDTGTGMGDTTIGSPRGVIRASELLDYDVENFNGEDLGDIDEAIVSLPDGCVDYMVLSFGGVLGLGDSQYIIPWRAVSINPDTNRLLLNVDPDSLANAPTFDANNLPDFTLPDWDAEWNQFWQNVDILDNPNVAGAVNNATNAVTETLTDATTGITATAEMTDSNMMGGQGMAGMAPCHESMAAMDSMATGAMTGTTAMTGTGATTDTGATGELTVANSNAIRLSELLDYEVRNPQGEDLGSIEDLMVDWRNDRIAYAILSFGGFLGLGDKWFPIPMDAMTLNTTDQRFIFDIDEQRLVNAPGFGPNELPDTADPNWDQEISNFWRNNQ